ncbi:MAG: DUF3971 domain-containing protein [Gammaproteobacteria bacterium]|nr:DUF3971 domain-containing protein [Gammaproteobacteria bacterium]MCY4356784.1 DUF3971 domain-containing protein [Gammaproteobacteria bacterium]
MKDQSRSKTMMRFTLLTQLKRQLVTLLVVVLVLLAAYVSLGRQFMPAISGYTGYLEDRILHSTGIPVLIEDLKGSFRGFNPVIRLDSLRIAADGGAKPMTSSSLLLGRVTLEVDMLHSLWQRRWVLKEFLIEDLDLLLQQNHEGGWQISGLELPQDDLQLNLDALYDALLGISQLDLTAVTVSLQTRSGDSLAFNNGAVTIRNQGDIHFVHFDTSLEDVPDLLGISMELRGNELSGMEGSLYLNMPKGDYSPLLAAQNLGPVNVQTLVGQGQFWLDLSAGKITTASSIIALDELVLAAESANPLQLKDLTGRATASWDSVLDLWEVAVSDLKLKYGEDSLDGFDSLLSWSPGKQLTAQANKINISLLSDMATASGLLDEAVQQQLVGYAPGGSLKNLFLRLPLDTTDLQPAQVRTNLDGVELGSFRGLPRLEGISGYLELGFDPRLQRLSGLGEVESDSFSIHIPNTFSDAWDYDYVNGRLHIDADLSNGEQLRLLSSVIVAESDAVDARVKFKSGLVLGSDGSRESTLSLMVGAKRADASLKSLYLPDGSRFQTSLRNSMDYLEGAIIAGDLEDSAVLYRGSTVSGSDPASKTFQSFFQVDNGVLQFSKEWPIVEQLSGLVMTDDNTVDMVVHAGSSLGINLEQTTGQIRRDASGRSLLTFSGEINADTAIGLDYLQQTPVSVALREALSGWEVKGSFKADAEVTVPISRQDSEPNVRLEFELADNELKISPFDLAITDLTGPVIFDSRTGLEESNLSAHLLGDTVALSLASEFSDRTLEAVNVSGTGSTTPAELIAWPGQSELVRIVLAQMGGNLDYQAQLRIVPSATEGNSNTLRLQSDLREIDLRFPAPLGKSTGSVLPLDLTLEFDEDDLSVGGSLGPDLRMDVDLDNLQLQRGLLTIGLDGTEAQSLSSEVGSGLIIGAELERFELAEWTAFMDRLDSAVGKAGQAGVNGNVSEFSFASNIAFIDLDADKFSLYDQELSQVAMRLIPDFERSGWSAAISSEVVAGMVLIPFDSEDYLRLELDYLHLPGEGEETLLAVSQPLADTGVLSNGPEQQTGLVAEQMSKKGVEEDKEVQGIPHQDTVVVMQPPDDQPESPSEGQIPMQQEGSLERKDPLADIDPRNLPLMEFSTNDFSIGARNFGSGGFRLVPTKTGAEFYDLNFDFRGLRLGRDEMDERIEKVEPFFSWQIDDGKPLSKLTGVLVADDIGAVLEANGYAPSLESNSAFFVTELTWPGSPAFFAAEGLGGRIDLLVEEGRFLRNSEGGQGALRLVSFINLTAIFQRLRFSDDLLGRGLAFDEISGNLTLEEGLLHINDQLVISGPSSLYQISGDVDLASETIEGEMYVTLPLSINLPWIGLLTANFPLAIGAYLFDRIFGDQVDSLSSAVYTLNGPLDGLEPEFKQAFGSPQASAEQLPDDN